MKTVSKTFECLLSNKHVTKNLYDKANIRIFACANFMQMSKFCDIPTKHTVKYIAFSLKWYMIYACVLNGYKVMHF